MARKETSLRQCIEELSSTNTDYKFPQQAINQAESLKSLSSDLYTDNIRFIYELIQNADDAQAKNIILTILGDKYFIITHNGKSFDEKDLQGLCGVNNGTKRKDPDKTGYKGLGFKAVFGKSNNVIIYSNGEYFRFDSSYKIKWNKQWGTNDQQTWEIENDRQFIYPWQINPVWTNENEISTKIRNFFNSKRKQIHVAYIISLNNVDEIYSAINQLKQEPYMFLFLRNISQITFLTESNDTISITRHSNFGLKQVNINNEIDSQWIIKRFELDVPNDIRDKLVGDSKAPEKLRFIKKAEMFFAAKYKDLITDENEEMISGGIEKLRDQDSILFSYLPTKISEYKFPILINANFLTNVNREQIHTDSVWNQWLFNKIGNEIFQWIREILKDKKFHSQAYRLIPSRLTSIDNILSKKFNESFEATIKNSKFILNRNNQLLKVNEAIMDSTSMSKQLSFININSMHQYIIKNDENHLQYVENPFIDYDSNLNQIGVKEFTWNQCIHMFKSDIFLKTHSSEQNKRMIEYFYSKFSKINTNINIEQIPFIMDQNNHLQLIKDIYFPIETISDNRINDSDDLFVNKIIFDWLNEKPQQLIKQWLQNLGIIERTDLTFLYKTIIPNALTYITPENSMKTIKMLFMLYQKHDIDKKVLNQLKKLKLLTIKKTLIPAEQCFFCDQYKPRLPLEEYLKIKEDKFLSFDYVNNGIFKQQNEELAEWRRFFIMMDVQEELQPLVFNRKLTFYEAARCGFCEPYLSTTSPDGKHRVDAFSGLVTIPFMKYTQNNYDFANVFWSYVIKNITVDNLTQNVKIYWGHFHKKGAIDGTPLENGHYINWFVKNIKCIPTTIKTCEISTNVFADNKELKELCGQYMCFPSISLPQDKIIWHKIFNFKTKLSSNDYFDLLEKIRLDEKNFNDNLDRIQIIYHHILKEIYFWSPVEQTKMKKRVKSCYLLTENNQWKLASDLYLYMEINGTNNNLNDEIPCLKLDYKNRHHLHLNQFLDLFNIKQIKMNDLKLSDEHSSPAEQFRKKLIEISPFLKKWLKNSSISSDIISEIDKKIQQENDFIESNCLRLYYNQNFVQETNVYFDNKYKQLYIRRPWDSETTFIDLPYKLCQLLNIRGFEKNIRFLLKGTIQEIQQHFITNSIEIPTEKDIVILEQLSTSDVSQQSKPSATLLSESNKSTCSIQNRETNSNKHENTSRTAGPFINNSRNQMCNTNTAFVLEQPYQGFPQHYPLPFADVIQEMNPLIKNNERLLAPVFIESQGEQLECMELIDVSSTITTNSVLFPNLFGGTGEWDSFDLTTGRTGEEMVYKYLLNKYRDQLNFISIKWENQNGETHRPYDISLREHGITHYIEVKSTRTYNQHIFPLSINQIETFLKYKENYFIYRVYIDEKKFVILDNIRLRLMQKQQLACFLGIIPIS